MTEPRHFHSARKGSGSLRPFPIYPLYTQAEILSLDKPIADCFLFRPRKSRRSAGNAVIPAFPIHRSHGLQHLRHKRLTFAFTGESGYTLAFANRSAHNGSQGETGAFWMGALSLPSERFARFGSPAWPGVRTANFAAFGPWSRGISKNAERAFGTAMRMMRVAVPRRRGPAGLRDPVAVSLTAPKRLTVLVSRIVGAQKIDRLFF